jgi:hypothetical protein
MSGGINDRLYLIVAADEAFFSLAGPEAVREVLSRRDIIYIFLNPNIPACRIFPRVIDGSVIVSVDRSAFRRI